MKLEEVKRSFGEDSFDVTVRCNQKEAEELIDRCFGKEAKE